MENMKKMGIRVPGIGHRIKSKVQSTEHPPALLFLQKHVLGGRAPSVMQQAILAQLQITGLLTWALL